MTGANLTSQLCSTEPDALHPDPVAGHADASGLEIAVSGAVKFAPRPLKLANVVPMTVSTVIDTARRVRSGKTMAAPPNDKLDVGIVSCPELLPDLWDVADPFHDALDELLSAAR